MRVKEKSSKRDPSKNKFVSLLDPFLVVVRVCLEILSYFTMFPEGHYTNTHVFNDGLLMLLLLKKQSPCSKHTCSTRVHFSKILFGNYVIKNLTKSIRTTVL